MLERGGGGSETQKFVYRKWPNQRFPFVNFLFSHDGHSGLEWGGGASRGGGGAPPMVYGHSDNSLEGTHYFA